MQHSEFLLIDRQLALLIEQWDFRFLRLVTTSPLISFYLVSPSCHLSPYSLIQGVDGSGFLTSFRVSVFRVKLSKIPRNSYVIRKIRKYKIHSEFRGNGIPWIPQLESLAPLPVPLSYPAANNFKLPTNIRMPHTSTLIYIDI